MSKITLMFKNIICFFSFPLFTRNVCRRRVRVEDGRVCTQHKHTHTQTHTHTNTHTHIYTHREGRLYSSSLKPFCLSSSKTVPGYIIFRMHTKILVVISSPIHCLHVAHGHAFFLQYHQHNIRFKVNFRELTMKVSPHYPERGNWKLTTGYSLVSHIKHGNIWLYNDVRLIIE